MRNFKVELLDPARLIKVNNLKEITNPIYFIRDGVPSTDGLLSNEIFGITKDDRANIFAYIDLGDWFIHPLIYKKWVSMDRKIANIISGIKKYKIEKGEFIEDENGKTGIKFLRDNMDNIKFKQTESSKRDANINFIMSNKDFIFMKQYIVIPAYYRDVNGGSGKIGVGEVNQLYDKLIIAVRALKESAEYGLSMSDATRFRIQTIMVDIYNWFTAEPNLAKKNGLTRQAVLSKTTDYASRLVLSAPDLRVEHYQDMFVDLDYSAVPLASLCSNLFPYMIFWLRRFFENEFSASGGYPYLDKKDNTVKYTTVKDPLLEFSDDRLKKELKRFIHGFSNRLIPIKIPVEEKKLDLHMFFKGRMTKNEDIPSGEANFLKRRLTWCDLFYRAAFEAAKDKHVMLTRYPIDSMYNQFPTKIRVSSTKETEPMYLGTDFYSHYPKIREEDILSNTSNTFVDTLRMCNAFLGAIGGDYDGDQVTAKVIYSIEANKELDEYINSKVYLVNLGSDLIRSTTNEGVQSIYNLTLILPDTPIVDPIFTPIKK